MEKIMIGNPGELTRVIGLQFFAEGGAGAGDAGTGAGQDAAAIDDAAQGGNDQSGQEAAQQGAGNEGAENAAAEDQPAAETPEQRAARYQQLRKEFAAELKRDLDATTKNVVERRLAKYKALAEATGTHYGLAPGDIDGMMKALGEDQNAIRERALKNQRSVEDQQIIERLEAREKQAQIEANEAKLMSAYEKVLNQAAECRAKYPDFDLGALENDVRAKGLLASGLMSVTEVYETINRDKLTQQAMQTAGAAAAEQVLGAVRQNLNRPSEGSVRGGSAAVTQISEDMLTPDVMAEIDRFTRRNGKCSEADMLAIVNAARRARR